MKRNFFYILAILFALAASCLIVWYFFHADIAMLNPKGMIAEKQRALLVNSTLLMLIVIIPVYLLTFFIIWRYRAKNSKAKYSPNWDFSFAAEAIWWAVPFAIVLVLSIMTWISSHELDPFKPIASPNGKKTLKIQVIALQWKWLFLYPEQNIATLNFIQIPEQTPILFEITADAPMNSFWIPELGGQVYAMPGMRTKLYLIANKEGSFRGSSAHLSGLGFAGMTFMTKVTSEEDFTRWVASVQKSPDRLNMQAYNQLVKPSQENRVAYYVLQKQDLYEEIVMKYMKPMPQMRE